MLLEQIVDRSGEERFDGRLMIEGDPFHGSDDFRREIAGKLFLPLPGWCCRRKLPGHFVGVGSDEGHLEQIAAWIEVDCAPFDSRPSLREGGQLTRVRLSVDGIEDPHPESL